MVARLRPWASSGTPCTSTPTTTLRRSAFKTRFAGLVETSSRGARILEQSDEIQVLPKDTVESFHFRGDSRQLLNQVAGAYGIIVTIDDSVVSRQVRFDVDDIGFYKAMQLAGAVTKTFWAPLQQKQIMVAADSTETRRLYDRMGMRTFYIPDASTPQALQDLVNVLRTVFEIKFVSSNAQKGTITVRAPVNVLEPASRFLEGLGSSHPGVMLDIRIFEVSRTLAHKFGLQIPNQFNLFNIPIGALGLTLAGGQSIQDVINQLIASGGINQANSTGLAALLAQLTGGNASIQPTCGYIRRWHDAVWGLSGNARCPTLA